MGNESAKNISMMLEPWGGRLGASLSPLLAMKTTLHFAPSFGRFSLFSDRRRLKKLASFDFLEYSIAFAFALKSAQHFLNGFTFSDFH